MLWGELSLLALAGSSKPRIILSSSLFNLDLIITCFFFFSSASAMDKAMAFAMISSSLIVVFVGSCCCFPVGRLWLDVVRAGGATGVLLV